MIKLSDSSERVTKIITKTLITGNAELSVLYNVQYNKDNEKNMNAK